VQCYAATGAEAAVEKIRELGRRAAEHGLDPLAVAGLHHLILVELLVRAAGPGERERLLRAYRLPVTGGDPAPAGQATGGLSHAHHLRLEAANYALRRANEMREEEARRIAHALHDDAAQLIASAHLSLDELGRETGLSEAQLEIVRRRLDDIDERLRTLSHELRPAMLDDLGLPAALDFLARSIGQRSAVRITVESTAICRLPALVEITLYRAVQEALSNAIRHGKPRQVKVRLRRSPRWVTCAVRDNGSGFRIGDRPRDAQACGLGLLGIRDRVEALGGTVRISSVPGRGTQIVVGIPLEQAQSAGAAGHRD
jgi:signal transduction histidine kinase